MRMKRKKRGKILTIIICSMLIFVVSCGGTTEQLAQSQNDAASASAVSGSAVSGAGVMEEQTAKRDDIADMERQLALFVEKKDRWFMGYGTGGSEYRDYSVADFDQNGKLEICRVDYEEDEGYQNTFWEVNEQNDDLVELQLDKKNQKDWLIDANDGYGMGYYEQDTDTYHYVTPSGVWPVMDNVDARAGLDMVKSEDKLDIHVDSDFQSLLATGRKFYYRIEWLGDNEDEYRSEVTEDELYQQLVQSAQEFRLCYSDELGGEIENPYFPYHEEKQTVKMEITWRDYEGITGEMIYTIYKVAEGTEGTLYFINDTDVKNVIDTKTGKKKPRSWWGDRVYNMAREYLWVTKDKIYLVEDFNNVVNPGQNDFGRLLFENKIHESAICICDESGNSPELPVGRRHAWKKGAGWIGYRCYGEEWHNYKMQQKGYEAFEDE